MPSFDVSVNMISLFAFIMVLGMVVDDAIVVGEHLWSTVSRACHRSPPRSPLCRKYGRGDDDRLTTVVAFLPLLFVTGVVGKFMRSIPIVVVLVLLVSLMEAVHSTCPPGRTPHPPRTPDAQSAHALS